ncbi:hypothetical protein LX32DRAFT_219739 [Colletotrichum zoysiae]|uniref:Uncharacterized protein n=1 Tax=Colletotrichum zoysiae TaxID=1216348 RepID=A0AAD9HQT8_9PEZI|nr:hypothetical protein LX32DRAFT_219739 [Colletotrichum zoysiae]
MPRLSRAPAAWRLSVSGPCWDVQPWGDPVLLSLFFSLSFSPTFGRRKNSASEAAPGGCQAGCAGAWTGPTHDGGGLSEHTCLWSSVP